MRPEDLTDRNALIAELDMSDRAALAPVLARVPLTRGLVLHESNQPIENVYFPEDGVVSVVSVHDGAPSTEIGIFGRDGFSGSAVMLGAESTPHRTFVQIDGASALRIATADLLAASDRRPALRRLLLRYVQVFVVQVASSATSNGQGRLDQRLARWLLMCHDRLDGDDIALTHDFMAMMITAQRTGVTGTLHVLEGQGLIRSLRGRVVVVDRAGLEALAGDSYGAPEAEHRRLIGPWSGASKTGRGASGSGSSHGGGATA